MNEGLITFPPPYLVAGIKQFGIFFRTQIQYFLKNKNLINWKRVLNLLFIILAIQSVKQIEN